MRIFATVAIPCLLLLPAAVSAQPADSQPSEQVTVFAPFVVRENISGPPHARVLTASASQAVNYHDLDLSTADGGTMLELRVKQAAENVCKMLDRRYPRSTYIPMSTTIQCTKDAEAGGLAQARAVIAAARS